MFIAFALLTLGIITLITMRDWVHYARPSSKSIQKSLKRIAQHISLQEWDAAMKELSPFLENGRGGQEAALLELHVLRGTGRHEEALLRLSEAIRAYPEQLILRLEEGHILMELGKPREALDAFQACAPILRTEPDLFSYASAFYQSGRAEECLEVLGPLLEKSRSGEVATLAGDALYELKRFEQAITYYAHAMQLGGASHHLQTQLGHSYRRLGNLAEAEKIFRSLHSQDPSDVEAILGIGACLQERGQHAKACLIYQAGLAWHRDLRLLSKAAYTALRTKRYSLAEGYLNEILQRQEADPQILAQYGLCLEGQKKWGEAENAYLELIHLFPESFQGYRALAWMFGVGLTQTITPEQGLHFAHTALKLQNDPVSWEILSACSARIGQFDQAYQIQVSLAKQDKDPQTRGRRQQSLRTLRKGLPLHDLHVLRYAVA